MIQAIMTALIANPETEKTLKIDTINMPRRPDHDKPEYI